MIVNELEKNMIEENSDNLSITENYCIDCISEPSVNNLSEIFVNLSRDISSFIKTLLSSLPVKIYIFDKNKNLVDTNDPNIPESYLNNKLKFDDIFKCVSYVDSSVLQTSLPVSLTPSHDPSVGAAAGKPGRNGKTKVSNIIILKNETEMFGEPITVCVTVELPNSVITVRKTRKSKSEGMKNE